MGVDQERRRAGEVLSERRERLHLVGEGLGERMRDRARAAMPANQAVVFRDWSRPVARGEGVLRPWLPGYRS